MYDGNGNVIASNDDYYGTDSFASLHLQAGTYYVGVSASGNANYDPTTYATAAQGGTNLGASTICG